MDFCSDAATRRRTAHRLTGRIFNGVALFLLALLSLAWSGESLAQSCDFVNVDPAPSKLGLPNTSVSFTFQAQTACAGTVTGTIAITTDSTGGATAPTTFSAILDTDETFSVLLGPTPGGTGTVVVTCLVGGCAGDTLTYTFGTNNDFDYIANVPTPVVANQITPFTLGTNLQFNGAPGALATTFTNITNPANYGTVNPDGAGDADITQSIFTAGNIVVRGTLNCPVAFVLEGCAAVAPVDMPVQIEPVQLLVVGSNTPSTPSGTPLTLTTDYGSASIPAADGTNITWSVTAQPAGGDGAVAGNAVLSGESTATFTATVPGTYTVNANSGCTFCATSQQNFTVTVTALPYTLVAGSANPATGTVGSPTAFTVHLEQGGTPVNAATIQWSANAPFAPATFTSGTNATGDATASFTPSAAGSFTGVVTATFDPDGVPASGDELSVAFDANVAAVPTLVVNSGDNQTTTVGSNFPAVLSVTAENSGVAAVGVTINWVVTSGSATITPSGPTDAFGEAHLSVTPTAPGPITVSATRQDAPAATVNFTNLLATALPFTLNTVSANPATGTVGTPIAFTVRLEQGGTPVNAATVQWSATAPFAPATFASGTNAAGDAVASFTPSAAGSFTGAVTATYDPDGVPANGDEVSISFDANVAFVATLAATAGGGQNALVNTAFALPLQVTALNSGIPAVGVTINWTVTGAATLVPGGATDGAGNATATVTAGATAGPVTITAARQDDPTATAVFNLTVDALGALAIVSGDGQTLAAGVASAPLEVELRDAGGLPVAGATISWSATAGTLANATTTTDAAGIASNTVTVTTAGAVDVTASSPLAAAPAVFSLNGALSSLPGLSVLQVEVANAIDNACPALAALPSRTPAQQDLLQRCQELTAAAGIDPPAAIGAIDQLMADVALTQANAAFSALQSQFQNLKTRIAALRSGTNGTSFGGLALNTPAGPISLGSLGAAFGAVEEPAEVGTDFSRWGFFAAGTIGRGEADPGQRNPAYDFDIEGLTAGVDYRKNDKWIFGASLGYTRQDTQLPGERGGLDTNGWTVSAYTTFYQQDSWYMDGVVTWGRNDYELLRRIRYTLPLAGGGTTSVDQTARADASGDLLSTATTFGRDFNRGAWGIGPYGRLLYTRVGFDAINETLQAGEPGSGLGLRIENRDVTSLASVLGGKFTYTHSADWGVLIPHLQLEWEHEFKDDPQAVEARFINDPTGTAMVVRGDPLDTDYFRLGLGLSMVLTEGRSGFFYYEQLVGRNGMSQWNLALGLRMEF
ncbi:autotransporter domain-containing protein [Arenimonas terrae]|uniref:Autotransporter domain-containing protein n=1 Tax=Arenimonas terrae TaxID=2546226 RepID=A0A5C4RVV7_9GAMM|nr:autotransporter domain-containing protein [Arenimonas terrae]TNJ35095.1 autotransporter domain-containing protein [Arenimonas terrae]